MIGAVYVSSGSREYACHHHLDSTFVTATRTAKLLNHPHDTLLHPTVLIPFHTGPLEREEGSHRVKQLQKGEDTCGEAGAIRAGCVSKCAADSEKDYVHGGGRAPGKGQRQKVQHGTDTLPIRGLQ